MIDLIWEINLFDAEKRRRRSERNVPSFAMYLLLVGGFDVSGAQYLQVQPAIKAIF